MRAEEALRLAREEELHLPAGVLGNPADATLMSGIQTEPGLAKLSEESELDAEEQTCMAWS